MTFAGKTNKGIFKPKNPKKYKGNPERIVYRSSWELRVMKDFDARDSVLWWASEELASPYKSPVDGRMHRYFPDFIARMKTRTGEEKTYVIEVKPHRQTQMPKMSRRTKTMLAEVSTYAVNQEKWRAAELFCLEHGWEFKILTEKDLGL
jgi:hypothetical protein